MSQHCRLVAMNFVTRVCIYLTIFAYIMSQHQKASVLSGWETSGAEGLDNSVRCAFFGRNLRSRSAIGSHAFAPLEASRRVTNDIPLGCSLLLPVHTVNCVQTLKAVDSLFSAPELGKVYGHPVDVYSLGITLFTVWGVGSVPRFMSASLC
jgi:hypothetical protein